MQDQVSRMNGNGPRGLRSVSPGAVATVRRAAISYAILVVEGFAQPPRKQRVCHVHGGIVAYRSTLALGPFRGRAGSDFAVAGGLAPDGSPPGGGPHARSARRRCL